MIMDNLLLVLNYLNKNKLENEENASPIFFL